MKASKLYTIGSLIGITGLLLGCQSELSAKALPDQSSSIETSGQIQEKSWRHATPAPTPIATATPKPTATPVPAPVPTATPVPSSGAISAGSSADAFVRDGSYASLNYGGANPLEVKTEVSSYNRDAYMKFDISGVSSVSSAVLTFYGSLDTDGVSIVTDIYGVSSSSWAEGSLTYNNRPALGSIIASVTGSGMSVAKFQVDLSSFVKSEKAAGKSAITIAFHNRDVSNIIMLVRSREDASYKPVLALNGSSLPASSATPVPTPVATPVPVSSATPAPTGPQLYVSTSGNDSNSGTQSAPFRTIQRAANAAYAGVTVRVLAGVYNEKIYSRNSGTSSAPIRFVSDTKYGAKVRPSSISGVIWENSGSYVEIEGFEIDGTNSPTAREGIYLHGSHTIARGNYVHHIHYNDACTSQGAGGIIGEGYYGDVDVNVIGNLIHNVGPSGCTFDHGIYHTGQGNVSNNVVYRASGAALHLWHDPRYITLANNTVSDSAFGIVLGGGDSYGTTTTPGDYITVANNIIYRCQTGVWAGGTLGNNNKFVNNLLFGNSTDWSLGKGSPTGTINADPQFVGYTTGGGGDYRLKSTSPAINRASSSYAPSYDFNGTVRPLGGAADIGAYESY